MDTEKLAALSHAYDAYPSSSYDEVLHEVHERIQATGSVGKSDIGALMLWKRLNLATVWARRLNNLPDADVRKITATAVELGGHGTVPEAAGEAREALVSLPGCGWSALAVPSTILTAAFPDRMAIYDQRAARSLRSLGFSSTGTDYGAYLAQLCTVAAAMPEFTDRSWVPRDVDKALFQMND